jgi:hypothetical protein
VATGFSLETIDCNAAGFLPSTTVLIQAKNPDGSKELDVKGSSLYIRSKMTHQLFVVLANYVLARRCAT